MSISEDIKTELLKVQKAEITVHHIYKQIAKTLPDAETRRIVEEISIDEKHHYEIWKTYTGKEVSPNRFQIWMYTTISRLFGFTFGVKLMELSEERAQVTYQKIADAIPEATAVIRDENEHSVKMVNILDEASLIYAGSVVLGLNDALVELTGVLAGLTFAFRDVNIIALSGLITGIAASLSMSASEYLSTKSEETKKEPLRAAITTGIAYMITVALLILPFLLLTNELISLAISVSTSVVIIALFNFYVSIANNQPFGKRFLEMTCLSMGVAGFSFLLGFLIRNWFNIEA